MATTPTPKTEKNDEQLHVSPTSDDTLMERYQKIISRPDKELIEALRTPSPFFADDFASKG